MVEPGSLASSGHAYPFPALPLVGRSGTSFKPQYLKAVLEDDSPVGFLEVHAENYMGAGGPPHAALERLRQDYPLSLHGVCLSIGGTKPLSQEHLARFASLVERYEPALVSEHLAWSAHGEVFYNDLLPLPYRDETLVRVSERVDAVQSAIGRRLLLENPATYVQFKETTWSETDFLREVAERTGCGLLLDVNNAFVSATNHGVSALDYLEALPLQQVGEIHLAGHRVQQDEEGAPLLIDSHDAAVADPVWSLYETVIGRCGPVPTLIEWDSALPEWPVLKAEARTAQRLLERHAGWSVASMDHGLSA